MHHIMALMVLKTVFAALQIYAAVFGFSFEQYKADLGIVISKTASVQVFYLLWAITLPLLFQYTGLDKAAS